MRKSFTTQISPLAASGAALKRLNAALSAAPANAGCHTFLATPSRDAQQGRWQRVRFANGVATHFRTEVIDSLKAQMPTVQELVMFGYDDPGSTQTTVFAKSEYPDMASWFDEVPDSTWINIFNGDQEFLNKVVMHVTTIDVTGSGNILTVFKQRTKTSLLRKRGMLAVLNPSSNEFVKVQGSVFDFSFAADFIEWEGFVYVFRLGTFESLTNVREVTFARAEEAIQAITTIPNLTVPGIDDFPAHLRSRVALTKKLAAAGRLGSNRSHPPAVRLPASWGCWAAMSPSERRRP